PRYLGKNPSQTGDQTQFSSNMPLAEQQAIVSGSSCPVVDYLHGLMLVTNRPQYFWHSNDRMKIGDIPSTCVFWHAYPHYHPSWNKRHCEEANIRAKNNGF